ncbi:MAG: diguanylate cyclase [Rhodanobacteraceae bacterium]|nr:diguanylate cyclase [Rhodanobacteraceae bacterium]
MLDHVMLLMRTVVQQLALVAWCLLLFASSPLRALDADRPLNTFTLSHWNGSSGLAHNMVIAIAQTPDGYLWLAGFEGLSRFNGTEFVVFDNNTLPLADANGIRALTVDSDGRLWVSSARSGLLAYEAQGWQHFGSAEGQPFEQLIGVETSSDGWLWLIGEESGIARWRPDRPAILVDHRNGLGHDNVYVTLADGAGGVYAGTAAGLDHVTAAGQVSPWGSQHGLPPGPVRSLRRAPNGELAVTVAGRVGWISDQGFRPLTGDQVPTTAQLLLYDSDGSLLIGTTDQGLWRVGAHGIDQLDRRHGLRGNRVVSLLEDREGSVWIGSSDGLYQLRDLQFTTIDRRHDIGEGYVRALWEHPAGVLWIGSTDGLYRRDGETVTRFGRDNGLPSDSIVSLTYSPQLGLLAGTFGAGIGRIVGDRVEPVPGTQPLAALQIRALLTRADDSLWMASNSGLFRLVGGQLTRFDRDQGLPRDFAMALTEDHFGHLWVGTSGGLARLEGERFEAFSKAQGLNAEDVFSIHSQPSGELWIGSNRGLKRFVDGHFEDIVGNDSAFNNSLFQILEDAQGSLWISSNRGIFLLPAAEVAAVRAGRSGPVQVQRFDRSDGLTSEQANGASQPAGIRLADDSLRFATAEGVAAVTPTRHYPRRPMRVDPVIEGVYADGTHIATTAGGMLAAGIRRLEFHYVGLSLLSPERVRYRHRLLGFDDQWVDAGSQLVAGYTNLAPGPYRFEVEASSGSVIRVKDFEFAIAPLWWQRRAVQAFVGVLIVLLLAATWRKRTTQLLHRSHELERLVAVRTRDLQTKALELAQADQEKGALVERLREQSEAFERQAREDWLTGLPNRRAFEELLQQQFAAAHANSGRLSVAIADIDHFKDINDRHSHATGDRVLTAVAEELRTGAGPDTLIARWGGEEFVLLFPGCDRDQAVSRCDSLRNAIAMRQPFFANGVPEHVTLSFGVAEFDAEHDRPEHLLSEADQHLYQAKSAGRNCIR